MHGRRTLYALLLLTVLIRLPFLNLAIQGDDPYYLYGAAHAQIDPLHPTHARYVFQGQVVDMRGHPHPPLNCWILAGLLAVCGTVREVPFHLAYLLFSLIAVGSMWALARRFTRRPGWATALFVLTPAFMVNGTSLESDLPFLAFWMASMALFVSATERRSAVRLAGAAGALVLASLAAYQAVVAVPILAFWLWTKQRRWVAGWAVLAVPVAVPAAWQLAERLTSGALPATVLAGYFQTYNLQSITNKLRNAAALTGHLAWIVFPALAVAALRLRRVEYVVVAVVTAGAAAVDPHPLFWGSIACGATVLLAVGRAVREEASRFLAVWVLVFFAACLVLFFAGSARYLLPLTAPLAMLVANRLVERGVRARWIYCSMAAQALLGLGLARVNMRQWNAYRAFVRGVESEFQHKRVWLNSEFGLRFYGEQEGGLPVVLGQAVAPGEMVLASDLALPIPLTTGGGRRVTLRSYEIDTWLPVRLIGLGSRSAFSAAAFGLRPFDLVFREPVDRIRLETVVERRPAVSDLPMNSPEAANQIVSGVFDLEDGQWRWMGERGVVLLKRPDRPAPVGVKFYLPPQATARQVSVTVDGMVMAQGSYTEAGMYTLQTGPMAAREETVTVEVRVDSTFSPPNDQRKLGMILHRVGFAER